MRDEYDDEPKRTSRPHGSLRELQRGDASVMRMGSLLVFGALVMLFVPWIIPTYTAIKIAVVAQLIISGFGLVMLLGGAGIITYSKLYVRTTADLAFVKTGKGGIEAIVDGGRLIVPVIHQIVPVSLRTMRLVVRRSGEDALITLDNLRVDITGEFYIKVPKQKEMVETAATTLGEQTTDEMAVKALVEDKLVSALRTVAATTELMKLHQERAAFVEQVTTMVRDDLHPNGLELESVTISQLDQCPLDEAAITANLFDAQGARTLAGIVQTARRERVAIETEADQEVRAREVDRDKQLATLNRDREAEVAQQGAETRKAQAAADRDARVTEAEQKRQAGIAEQESEQAVGIAEATRTREVSVAKVAATQAEETANVGREQAVAVAGVAKERAVVTEDEQLQLAQRKRDTQVAEADTTLATTRATQLTADAERERAAQQVETVTVTETAEREKKRAVIDRQAAAEQTQITRNMEADVTAYETARVAEGEEQAAKHSAAAARTQAEGDRDAAKLRAEGDQAEKMVPVQVDREQVNVEQARVGVLQNELAAKDQHARISMELEIAKAQIDADRDVRIAAAQAMGEALGGAKMTFWGTPDALDKMISAFETGQRATQFAGGLASGIPSSIRPLVTHGGANILAGLIKRATGQEVDPEVLEDVLQGLTEESQGAIPRTDTGIPTVDTVTQQPPDTAGDEAEADEESGVGSTDDEDDEPSSEGE